MKKYFPLLLSVTLVSCTQNADEGPLRFATPEGIEVIYEEIDERLPFYMLHWEDEDALLMVSRWPPPVARSDVKDAVMNMAVEFMKLVDEDDQIELATREYQLTEIQEQELHGFVAQFTIDEDGNTMNQSMSLIHDGIQVWSAQFTGTAESFDAALEILRTMKRRD